MRFLVGFAFLHIFLGSGSSLVRNARSFVDPLSTPVIVSEVVVKKL